MQEFFFVSEFTTFQYMTAISYYFVYIHIALRTATRLPHYQWKIIIQFSIQYFITYFADQSSFILCQHTGFLVCNGRRFFQVSKSTDDFFWHSINILCDPEIVDAALCLCAIVGVSRHFHFAHGVFFYTIIHTIQFCAANVGN